LHTNEKNPIILKLLTTATTTAAMKTIRKLTEQPEATKTIYRRKSKVRKKSSRKKSRRRA